LPNQKAPSAREDPDNGPDVNPVHEKVVAQPAGLPAVVRVEIIIIHGGAARIYVTVSAKVGAGFAS